MKRPHMKFFGLLLAMALVFAFSSTALADDNFQGSGTAEDPFLISTSADLMNLATLVNQPGSVWRVYGSAYYLLTNDIDMAGYDWIPIGANSTRIFHGDFNGGNWTISNLGNTTVSGASRGLFGWVGTSTQLTQSGKVYNVNLENVNFSGNGGATTVGIGGIAGVLHTGGVIENCIVTGIRTATERTETIAGENIGGVVGIVVGTNATISNCRFIGDIIAENSGAEFLGSIVGRINNTGLTVENCYSEGTIYRPDIGGQWIGKITGGGSSDYFLSTTNFINNTTRMTIDAEPSYVGGWESHNGIELFDSSADLSVTVDQTLIKTNDSFNVNLSFTATQESNAAVFTLAYDANLFTYTGFTPADGLTLISADADAGLLTIILGNFDEYNMTTLGTVSFTANNSLPEGDNDFSASVEYVFFNADGEKATAAVNGSASVTTQGQGAVVNPPAVPGDTNGDDNVDLIDLSNIIDWFGFDNTHAEWDSLIKFFDFNENGVIDISDITYIASQI